MKTFFITLSVFLLLVIGLKWTHSNDLKRNMIWDTKLQECRSLGANYDLRANGCIDVTKE